MAPPNRRAGGDGFFMGNNMNKWVIEEFDEFPGLEV
jgi:hypothetical protein